MDKLSEFQCFLQVAALGSFTAASSVLNITPSAASKQVKSLEDRLGARLFNRTTRHVSLTELGQAFRVRIEPLLTEVEEAEGIVTRMHVEPRGRLRISAPMDFGRAHLSGHLARFASEHSDLEVDVEFTDRFVEVVEEGFDVAVRIGTLADSSLVARYLGPCRRVVCGSPNYLAEHGVLRDVSELSGQTRVAYAYESERVWTLTRNGEASRANLPLRHRSNNGEFMRNLVLAGQGVALLPTFLVGDDLRSGRLEVVFGSYSVDDLPIHALYPHRKYLSAKVRSFVDFLAEICGLDPSWDAGLEY